MSLRTSLGDAHRAFLRGVARREARIENDRPYVSFTFDDFPKTALTVGGKILEDSGARGTYYAAPGLMGTISEVGLNFDKEDLQQLIASGHELGNHTYSHVHARRTP